MTARLTTTTGIPMSGVDAVEDLLEIGATLGVQVARVLLGTLMPPAMLAGPCPPFGVPALGLPVGGPGLLPAMIQACFTPLALPFGLRRRRVRRPRTAACGCDIPTPFWLPQPAGEVVSGACPGGSVTLRLEIVNDGPTARVFDFDVATAAAGGQCAIAPPSLNLGAKLSDFVAVTYTVPAQSAVGESRDVLVWVLGCQTHYVRWRVVTAAFAFNQCQELTVVDGPVFEHHWYDHFYCEHPCAPARGR